LIVLRSVLFNLLFYVLSTLHAVAMVLLLPFPPRYTRAAIRLWALHITFWLRVICNIRAEVRGREYMPKGAALVAGKHLSFFDTCAPFAFLPQAAFVLKKELVSIPLFGWYCVKAEMVVVDREGHSKALKKMVADARARFDDGRPVLIFPEGTRGVPGQPGDYKPGIAALYRELEMPCSLMATNTGVHWLNKNFLRRPGTVVFEFLPPIPPGLKRAAFMQELETRLETASLALLAE
jgi:1-acyl-sn-glycerol-3-phosphate acyltransferase